MVIFSVKSICGTVHFLIKLESAHEQRITDNWSHWPVICNWVWPANTARAARRQPACASPGKETHCARGRGDSACHTVSGHPNWRSVVGPMVSKALGSHRHREKLDHTICLISQDCLLLLVPLRVEVTSSQHHTRLSMCCSLPASQSCPLTSPLPPNPPPLLQPHRPAGSSHSGRQPQDPRMCYFLQSYAWLSPSPPSHLCYMFPIFKET